MGILRFGTEADGVHVGDDEDTEAVEKAKKDVTKFIIPIVLIVFLSLGMTVASMASYEWYVADVTGCSLVHDGVYLPSHYGLKAQKYDLGGQDMAGASYENKHNDESHESVAYDLFYILTSVLLMSCLFMYLVGRMEDVLEKGGSKWSFLLPSIVGTVILMMLWSGLLYFYMAFEDALLETMGEGVEWTTAGYGWPIWMLTFAGLVLFLAIALSYWCSWRAIDVTRMEKKRTLGASR